jgi:hypothetical protein
LRSGYGRDQFVGTPRIDNRSQQSISWGVLSACETHQHRDGFRDQFGHSSDLVTRPNRIMHDAARFAR